MKIKNVEKIFHKSNQMFVTNSNLKTTNNQEWFPAICSYLKIAHPAVGLRVVVRFPWAFRGGTKTVRFFITQSVRTPLHRQTDEQFRLAYFIQ